MEEHEGLPTVISNLAESLSSFHDVKTRVHTSTEAWGSSTEQYRKSFERLIVSMQRYDITR